METSSVTYDLLKSIHSEIKIAVQNHQLLVLRRKMCPSDPDVENHINVTQGLIVSLGRTQAELLSQLRKEPGFPDMKLRLQSSPNFVPKGVPHPQIKHIPIYKFNASSNNKDKEKKIGFLKYGRKDTIIQLPKVMQQSLLKIKGRIPTRKELEQKIIDGTKIKLVYNKKNEEQSVLKNPKKQMSVLKSKNDKPKEILSCINESHEKLASEKTDSSPADENSQIKSEFTTSISPCSINGDSKFVKTTSSRSSSHSDESEINESSQEKANFSSQREPKLVKKYDTRFLRKKKYSAFLPGIVKKLKSESDSKDKIDGESSGNETNEIKPLKPEDIGQELFLIYFGLVSKAKGDVLKRKRCERKRRSVAGQSSLYSDYYQPVTQSKRTYSKKSISSPSSPTNQVIVETATEVDDEDEKPKYCMVCNESGVLDMCQSCSGTYHEKCKPNPNNGCPNCSPQPTDINSIVGANFFASPSSYEIIKRYSTPVTEVNESMNEENVKN